MEQDLRGMLGELDALYAKGAMKEAEEKLAAWRAQAYAEGNRGVALSLCNEMEGLYRTTGRAAQAVAVSDEALRLIGEMGLTGTIHHGTTLLNGATACRMAGDAKRALSMYGEAAGIFRALGEARGYQMASLYNNVSQIYQEQGRHEEALASLDRAMELLDTMEQSEAEMATSRVNRALSLMALGRLSQAKEELEKSLAYYESPAAAGDGHYGAALSAAGELAWRTGDRERAVSCLEQALRVTRERFGENDACRVIRMNLETVKNMAGGSGAGEERAQ